ncbi:MAG: alanine dehydrogenase [Thermodesulfobacteriota bacterium]
MIIGVPKERRKNEYRVSITPAGVKALTGQGHTVLIEKNAGKGSNFSDAQYLSVGATVLDGRKKNYEEADLIVTVKEPLPEEYDLFQEDQMLFTFLHLAANNDLAHMLIERRITAIAYETVELDNGSLPILTPMSEVAGKIAVQSGTYMLQKHNKGRGVLLGGVPGVEQGKVTIIGGGVVGLNAAKVAFGLGAEVTLLDIDLGRLAYLDDIFGEKIETIMSSALNIEKQVLESDLVIGAVLVTGDRAPVLVTRKMIEKMRDGSVIADVAIDQGGCVETSRPTTHSSPTFVEMGVAHFCVTNLPGAVPRTSTVALSNTTLSYIQRLANSGFKKYVTKDNAFSKGVNVFEGKITHQAVAKALDMKYTPLEKVI